MDTFYVPRVIVCKRSEKKRIIRSVAFHIALHSILLYFLLLILQHSLWHTSSYTTKHSRNQHMVIKYYLCVLSASQWLSQFCRSTVWLVLMLVCASQFTSSFSIPSFRADFLSPARNNKMSINWREKIRNLLTSRQNEGPIWYFVYICALCIPCPSIFGPL